MNNFITYNFMVFLLALIISTIFAIFVMRLLKVKENILGKITAFALGNTLVLTIKELYVDTIEKCGYESGILYIIMGIFIMILINYILHILNKENKNLNSLILILIAMIAHKIPEGIIIGISLQTLTKQGIIIILILLIHSVFDVMIMAAPMISNKFSDKKMANYIIVITLSSLLGVVVGLEMTTEYMLGMGLGISCGIMLYVSLVEMPREALELTGKKDTIIYTIIGIIAGMIII